MKGKIPDPASAEFAQMAMAQAMEESQDIIKELITRYATGKYSLTTVPPTWAAVKALPTQDGVDTVIRMIQQTPYFRSEGLGFAKKVLAGLEAQRGSADTGSSG